MRTAPARKRCEASLAPGGSREGLVTADVGRIDFQFTFDEQGNIASEEVVFAAGQWPGPNVFNDTLCSVLQ